MKSFLAVCAVLVSSITASANINPNAVLFQAPPVLQSEPISFETVRLEKVEVGEGTPVYNLIATAKMNVVCTNFPKALVTINEGDFENVKIDVLAATSPMPSNIMVCHAIMLKDFTFTLATYNQIPQSITVNGQPVSLQ